MRQALAVLPFVLLAGAAPARAGDLAIAVVAQSPPRRPPGRATLFVRTVPGARCSINVDYKLARPEAKSKTPGTLGLYAQVTDSEGRAAWQWRVPAGAARGRWPIVVDCAKGGRRGELKTSFEVR